MGEYFSLIWQKQVSTNQGRVIFFPQTKYCVNLRTRKEIGNNFKNYTFRSVTSCCFNKKLHPWKCIYHICPINDLTSRGHSKIYWENNYWHHLLTKQWLPVNNQWPCIHCWPANSIRMMNFYQTRNSRLINPQTPYRI